MSAQDNLGKQFKPIGYDYNGQVEGTLCTKCHNSYTKKSPNWLDGTEASPLYKHELKTRDPKKYYYIECGECGKQLWGKPDFD